MVVNWPTGWLAKLVVPGYGIGWATVTVYLVLVDVCWLRSMADIDVIGSMICNLTHQCIAIYFEFNKFKIWAIKITTTPGEWCQWCSQQSVDISVHILAFATYLHWYTIYSDMSGGDHWAAVQLLVLACLPPCRPLRCHIQTYHQPATDQPGMYM